MNSSSFDSLYIAMHIRSSWIFAEHTQKQHNAPDSIELHACKKIYRLPTDMAAIYSFNVATMPTIKFSKCPHKTSEQLNPCIVAQLFDV